MDTQPVIEQISAIPVGTIVAWVIVIGGIIAAIVAGIVKLYKVFEKYREYKEKYEEQKTTLEHHDEILKNIQESLSRIESDYQTEHEAQRRWLKHEITKECNKAIKEGQVFLSALRSIEELNDDYIEIFDGNSWVHTLIEKVELLPVIQDIDEG